MTPDPWAAWREAVARVRASLDCTSPLSFHDVDILARAVAALLPVARFGAAVFENFHANGWYTAYEPDEFIEDAVASGLLREESYDPAKHGDPGDEDPDVQPGDHYLVMTDEGRAARAVAEGGKDENEGLVD